VRARCSAPWLPACPCCSYLKGPISNSNADRVAAAGAARKLLRNEVTAPAVRESVAALIGERGYRLAAERIGAEIAAMPPPAQALAAITTSML
jgi:UDP:flavonoid glycosyltransferase YjiC (YdhE family)